MYMMKMAPIKDYQCSEEGRLGEPKAKRIMTEKKDEKDLTDDFDSEDGN